MTTREQVQEVTAEHARKLMKDLLDATQHHDGNILITRHDKPAGRLIDPNVNVPHAYDWAAAQQAYEWAKARGGYAAASPSAQEAIDALGVLLGTYYGRRDTGISHEPAEETG